MVLNAAKACVQVRKSAAVCAALTRARPALPMFTGCVRRLLSGFRGSNGDVWQAHRQRSACRLMLWLAALDGCLGCSPLAKFGSGDTVTHAAFDGESSAAESFPAARLVRRVGGWRGALGARFAQGLLSPLTRCEGHACWLVWLLVWPGRPGLRKCWLRRMALQRLPTWVCQAGADKLAGVDFMQCLACAG